MGPESEPARRTPAEVGFSMPAEWKSHRACYISWPCKPETWFGHEARAKAAYAAVANAISRFEPVIVLTPRRLLAEARHHLGREVQVEEMDLDDAWIRDNGPIFVRSPNGNLAAVGFRFNGWGERFVPYSRDARVPEVLASRLGLPLYRAPLVLEGGAIAVDGEGTVLTTESCLLNPNRNPGMTKESIEEALRSYLGVRKVLWLRQGMHHSQVDGHIDGIAAFARPRTVIAGAVEDPSDPNHTILRENRERLGTETDARGRPLEVLDLPFPTLRQLDGLRVAATYMNFYIANGGIVAPVFGDRVDRAALDRLRTIFPDREVAGVRSEHIAVGGGVIHCITQQLPAGR
jgi:agmatine deiminase